ncbi:MAG: glycine zipper domain-containing protein [Candidatus Moranbacteria bacterium]|nr:glycine zipper domain-containing protein [Candidatus Moranbacteria bacterium]
MITRVITFFSLLCLPLLVIGCANPGYYNMQKGAAAGGALGAITGQIIGEDTESTLWGAGIGAGVGSIIGNMFDQQRQMQRDSYFQQKLKGQGQSYQSHPSGSSYGNYGTPSQPATEPPRGRWVQVPGHWGSDGWVPAHNEWHPTN